jgi:uncharacterized membrane protein YecN with MAPEG domain
MHSPVFSVAAAGVLGLLYTALCVRVVMGRRDGSVMLGTAGEQGPLYVAYRSQANFAEYVPLCLILIGGIELTEGSSILVKVLCAMLVLARIAHPIGMTMKSPNAFRALGFVGTVLVLVAASIAAIKNVLF